MQKYYQQGDVVIVPVKSSKLKKKKTLDHNILADGEATGHSHALNGDVLLHETETELYEDDYLSEKVDRLITETFGKHVEVVHEEHGKIALPEKTFESFRIREYDHFAEEARNVAD